MPSALVWLQEELIKTHNRAFSTAALQENKDFCQKISQIMHACNGSTLYKFLSFFLNIEFLEKVFTSTVKSYFDCQNCGSVSLSDTSTSTVKLTLEFISVINKLRMAITNDVLNKLWLMKYPAISFSESYT